MKLKLCVGLLVGLVCVIGMVSANSFEASINEPLFIKTVCDGAGAAAEITIYSGTAVNPDNLVVPRTAMDALSDKDFEYVATFGEKGQYTAFEFCTYGGGFETTQQTDISVTDPQNLIEASTEQGYQYQASLFYDVFFKSDPTQEDTLLFKVGNSSVSVQPLDIGLVEVGKDGKSNGKGIHIDASDVKGGRAHKEKKTRKMVYLPATNVTGAPIGNIFAYQGIYGEGLDLQYLVNKKYVKEEAVVADFASLPLPNKELKKHLADVSVQLNSLITLNGNKMIVNGWVWDMKKPIKTSDVVVVKDAANNTLYQLQIPVAFDTNGAKIVGSYTLTKEEKGKSVLVQANVPYSWFADPARVYPVYIDPTIDTPDGTAQFGTGIPYINISDLTIPAGSPYTITEQIMVDNTTIFDAECEMNLVNLTDDSYSIYFRSFYNDGNGNMLFVMDGVNAPMPPAGSYELQQYCWHGLTLDLNKIYSNSTIVVN